MNFITLADGVCLLATDWHDKTKTAETSMNKLTTGLVHRESSPSN